MGNRKYDPGNRKYDPDFKREAVRMVVEDRSRPWCLGGRAEPGHNSWGREVVGTETPGSSGRRLCRACCSGFAGGGTEATAQGK